MFTPAFLAQVLAAASFPQGVGDNSKVYSATIGDIKTLTQGTSQPRPAITLQPSTAPYTSITWDVQPPEVANLVGSGETSTINIVGPGDFTVTAEVLNEDGSKVTGSRTFTVDALQPQFTVQPGADALPAAGTVYFQEGGQLRITGAAATNVTKWQWQKQSQDGAWANLQGASPDKELTVSVAKASDEGVYRLMAVNGNKSAQSEPVTATNAFLFIQNDGSNNPGTQFSIAKDDNYNWHMVNAVQSGATRYPAIRGIRAPSSPNTNLTTIAGPIVVAVDNPDIVKLKPGSGIQAPITLDGKVGTAILTLQYGLLSARVTIAVDYATPTITTQPPATLAVAVGATINITPVVATNTAATATYQWQKLNADGTTWDNIAGATAVKFTKAAAAAADSGSYRLRIKNGPTITADTGVCVVTVS